MDYEFRTRDVGNAREEGGDDDVNKILSGMREGATYWEACRRIPIPVKRAWLEKIQPLVEKWHKEGRPPPPSLVPQTGPKLLDHIVKEGKIFAIYADGTAREVKVVSEVKK